MGKMTKLVLFFALAFTILIGAYASLRINAAFNNGYAWSDMDWDEDGRTTVLEAIAGSDVGNRKKIIDGLNCKEYFALKDAQPLKTVCED
ncbi:hypothetical protein [Roseovarius sp. 217]|uniref:hypothetical protein n=1 Tax=Roseovarius sp. (strain 217) TaxID=314264 RepID=UPI00006857E9|nr:hypothetical protein [Roseovarius sp. 217]EAQ26599.1 hypothetical protein ROS217_18772 [Roseovarius sp. 217]